MRAYTWCIEEIKRRASPIALSSGWSVRRIFEKVIAQVPKPLRTEIDDAIFFRHSVAYAVGLVPDIKFPSPEVASLN